MTLVQLRHLISLASTGSFTRSAEQMFLTQSALSRSIQALEEELQQPLFDRIGRRAELTPFGREAVRRARQVVAEAEELVASGRHMAEGRAGTIRIGMGPSPSALLAAPVLKTMASRHPAVHVEIRHGDAEFLVGLLRAREVDVLVVESRSLAPAIDLRVDAMVEMKGAFLCRPGHPLTRRRGPLHFDAIRAYPLASTPLAAELARNMVELYGPAGNPEVCVTLRSSDLAYLIQAVSASDAVLLAIRAAAPKLVELPIRPAIVTSARFGMVTLAGRTETPTLPVVRELMQALLHD